MSGAPRLFRIHGDSLLKSIIGIRKPGLQTKPNWSCLRISTTSYSHPTRLKIYAIRTDDWQRKVELRKRVGNTGSTIVSNRLLVVFFE